MRKWIIAALALACGGNAGAHGGGLNKDGCHNDRKNGGYHCHRSPSAAPANDYAPRVVSPYAQGLQPSGPSGTSFRNCTHARAAGAAPVRRGDPGYGPHLDRDGDGVGCE
ncbi:excalibur calcium-binding domain-containing protein [Lysobacter panacisoli]|nr:excalibur calcium-binding domain-containing protein [Lysobacter panacisoli]